MKPKAKITEQDYVIAMKKVNHELEIALFGKQVSMCKTCTHKSKKVYDRKKNKKITITD